MPTRTPDRSRTNPIAQEQENLANANCVSAGLSFVTEQVLNEQHKAGQDVEKHNRIQNPTGIVFLATSPLDLSQEGNKPHAGEDVESADSFLDPAEERIEELAYSEDPNAPPLVELHKSGWRTSATRAGADLDSYYPSLSRA